MHRVMRRKRRLLIIEDNDTLRESLRRAFAKEGYEVITTPAAEEGLGLVLGHLFDLILVDLKLPRHDGDSFIRQIRQIGCRSEVVLMTGSDNVDPAAIAAAVGARAFVLKGADFFVQIRDTVRSILNANPVVETAH